MSFQVYQKSLKKYPKKGLKIKHLELYPLFFPCILHIQLENHKVLLLTKILEKLQETSFFWEALAYLEKEGFFACSMKVLESFVTREQHTNR